MLFENGLLYIPSRILFIGEVYVYVLFPVLTFVMTNVSLLQALHLSLWLHLLLKGPSFSKSNVSTSMGGKASLQPKRTPVSEEEIEAILVCLSSSICE